jgi:hypothetical protein
MFDPLRIVEKQETTGREAVISGRYHGGARNKTFEPVLMKLIERSLLEMELRKIYPEEVKTRYRDFATSGRSLNFGTEDLEGDKESDKDS